MSESHLVELPTSTRSKKRFPKLQQKLRRNVCTAIADFGMIAEGDHVMVCLSGGKDSYTLLSLLELLQKTAPVSFTLVAVHLDQGHPGYPAHVMPEFLSSTGIPYRIERQDTYQTVKNTLAEGDTMCSLCSRLRRGVLYRLAHELGATKIALGHHREDILETFLLNFLFAGKLKAMAPKYRSDDGKYTVIRPLAYCNEADIAQFAQQKAFPIIPCNLCGSQEDLKRKKMKATLAEWEKDMPGRKRVMFSALRSLVPEHLLDTRFHECASPEQAEQNRLLWMGYPEDLTPTGSL